MKIKLDENLPVQSVNLLNDLGHEVHTLHHEDLAGRPDGVVWQAAQKEARFLITQDMDFSDLRKFAPGTHHGILLIRLRSPSRKDLLARIEDIFRTESTADWRGCFIVATERKLRVLRPLNK